MTLLAVPNISEGRDRDMVMRCRDAVASAGAAVLDLHSDEAHNRSVLTLAARAELLVDACVLLAGAASGVDLRVHVGTHPRLGGLDVCPFVPHGTASIGEAVDAARRTGARIGDELGLPVFLYGRAARRVEPVELPVLRRGGLSGLAHRVHDGLLPDFGPQEVDPGRGVVCVGARGPLIAFNVWIDASAETARSIAADVRSPSLRALGMQMPGGVAQVSMNLIDPAVTGIEDAFHAVRARAEAKGGRVVATEIVGLVEERFLPSPETTVARLLTEPSRSVEEALQQVR